MRLDDDVATILGDGGPELFARPASQAFPRLTVDSGGLPHVCLELSPLQFRLSPELVVEERWSRDAAVLRALAGAGPRPQGD